MAIKDEIQAAREQNRLNIPAKRLMEKLKPIPSNVNDLQHRWFWELLQNASDYNDSVDVALVLFKDRIVFMHNGNPFRPSDTENLIAPDSGKDSDELKEQDMIGQFGTGFISTHVVSPVVKVEGVIKSEIEKDQFLSFHFTLDRSAYDDKEELKKSIPKISADLDRSIEKIDYQPGDFYTKFTYYLDHSLPNINSREVVKEGLRYLEDVLPYTLAFMPKIKSVTIHNNSTDLVAYENRIFKPQSTAKDELINVGVFEHDTLIESINLNLFNVNDAQLLIRIEDNTIVPYPGGITKLFCSLPMIGTEAFGFPFVLNSKKFVPHLERDGISLTVSDTENRSILADAVSSHKKAIEVLTKVRAENWPCIVTWSTMSFKTIQEKNWFKTEVTDKIKVTYLDAEIVKTSNGWIKLRDAVIPYAPKDDYTEEELLEFYDLVYELKSVCLPQRSDFINWFNHLDFSIFSDLAFSLEDFIKELSSLGSLEQITLKNLKPTEWLNEVLDFVLLQDPDLLDKYGIIPNRVGNFVRRKDQIYWNDDIDKFKWSLDKDQLEKVVEQYNDKISPLKFLIVTAKLLTGFDAPILQTMYLDKSLKDHTLLQAICRTNRLYPNKTFGRIVDYFGIFDDAAEALQFDDKSVAKVITNLKELSAQLPLAVTDCLAHFEGVDRKLVGFEGLEAAQNKINTDEKRDAFAKDYTFLSKLWESLSPDRVLDAYQEDYRWLTGVYQSTRPAVDNVGKLLWHALGTQTTKLIHENITVRGIHDDLEEFVLDADVIDDIFNNPNDKKIKKLEKELIKRFKKYEGDPRFKALGERLEDLRDRAEKGLIASIDFVKELCKLAKDVVQAEKDSLSQDELHSAKAALTELFLESKTEQTPAVVERIVNDIDEIVKVVRFPGWQSTASGEREVQKSLRKTLLKYKLHKDQQLFERAYAYIKGYY